MVKIPKDVAEAIERFWSKWCSSAHYKHIKLTDWTAIAARDSEAFCILIDYCKKNPVTYMKALQEGYEVVGD